MFTSIYPKNVRKWIVKSIRNLQQTALLDISTSISCNGYGTSNEKSLSTLMISSSSRYNSQKHQILMNHLWISMIILYHLHLQNPSYGQYLMKSSYNLHLHYASSKSMETFNPIMIHLPLSTSCDDPTLNSDEISFAMKSKPLSHEKSDHSYTYCPKDTPYHWDGSVELNMMQQISLKNIKAALSLKDLHKRLN